MKKLGFVAVLVLGLSLSAWLFFGVPTVQTARAEEITTTWDGSGTDWHDPNGWSNGVPDNTKTAIINDDCMISETSATAYKVQVAAYKMLTLNRCLVVQNKIECAAYSGVLLSSAGAVVQSPEIRSTSTSTSSMPTLTLMNGYVESNVIKGMSIGLNPDGQYVAIYSSQHIRS